MAPETDTFEGIILRTYPFGEADLILRVLSADQGKRSLIARNARREKSRYKVHIDVLDQGSFSVRETRGSLEPLVDFKPIRSFVNIRGDIDRLIIASLIVEAYDHLVHEHTHEAADFFESLSLTLQALHEARTTREALKACYLSLHSLLTIAGYGKNSQEAPSLKKLYFLIDHIERVSEKELSTKSSFIPLLQGWEQEIQALKKASQNVDTSGQ